jgi:hypothetical protein
VLQRAVRHWLRTRIRPPRTSSLCLSPLVVPNPICSGRVRLRAGGVAA